MSNAAVKAISAAMENVRNYKTTVPAHLQDAHYKGSQKLGHGVGYKYAHDYPNHYVEQQYMPSEIQKAKFYEPSDNGHEKEIKEWMEFFIEKTYNRSRICTVVRNVAPECMLLSGGKIK